jgi:hypothetical protein
VIFENVRARLVLRFVGVFIVTALLPIRLEAQNPRVWRVVEELRIGSVDDEAQALASIGVLDVDARSAIYVTQPTDHNIRVFDASGRLVRVIGRKGGGPGEFEGLGAIGFRGDTLFASDSRLLRTSLFALDGRFITSFRLTNLVLKPPFMSGGATHLLSDGSMLFMPGLIGMPDGQENDLRFPTLRLARDGAILDTALILIWRNSRLIVNYGDRTTFTSQPFNDDPLAAIATSGSHGFAVDRRSVQEASRAQFRITKFRLNGDTIWSRAYNYAARRLENASIDSVLQVVERAHPGRAAFAAAYRKAAFFPKYWPPIARAIASAEGGLWLQLNEANRGTFRWLVFDADGNSVSTVNVPAAAQIRRVVGDRAYATVTDELGVPFVVRYRIQK